MVDCENCRYRFILANTFDIHVDHLDCDKYGSDLCKEMNKPEWIERTKEQLEDE